MSNCYLSQKTLEAGEAERCEGGFMGRTHVTSAIALFLACFAFLPTFSKDLLGTEDLWLITMAAIAAAGGSLLPDLDNTSSTARNSLGPVGHIVSEAIRAISVFLQTFIRTSRDDAEPNPHRGAAHTVPAALLFGGGALFLTKIGGEVNLPLLGVTPWGDVSAILILFAMLHLALSGLVKPLMKKIGNSSPIGELGAFALSLGVSVVLYTQAPDSGTYWWLGVAIAFGVFVHILGDCFTTAGAPILFPLSALFKGKFWWNTRFTSIKAGGVTENVLFVPLFILLGLISSLRILGLY